jgi:hypothetical protein
LEYLEVGRTGMRLAAAKGRFAQLKLHYTLDEYTTGR